MHCDSLTKWIVKYKFELNFNTVVDDGFEAPVEEVDDGPLPDWAIAVVVIGLGSFAFVLIFGLSVVSLTIYPSLRLFLRGYCNNY